MPISAHNSSFSFDCIQYQQIGCDLYANGKCCEWKLPNSSSASVAIFRVSTTINETVFSTCSILWHFFILFIVHSTVRHMYKLLKAKKKERREINKTATKSSFNRFASYCLVGGLFWRQHFNSTINLMPCHKFHSYLELKFMWADFTRCVCALLLLGEREWKLHFKCRCWNSSFNTPHENTTKTDSPK